MLLETEDKQDTVERLFCINSLWDSATGHYLESSFGLIQCITSAAGNLQDIATAL